MGIGTRDISRIDDPRVLEALRILGRAARGLGDPIDAKQAIREAVAGTSRESNIFSKFYFGTWRSQTMFTLYTPTQPVYLRHIMAYDVGSAASYLGILPTGSPNFTSVISTRKIETVPNTGGVVDDDGILFWNCTMQVNNQKMYETVGPGKLIPVGKSLFLWNNSGSNMYFQVRMEFEYA